MPYKSDAQRKFMHAKHPEIAARWDKEYPHQGHLPEHVKKSKHKKIEEHDKKKVKEKLAAMSKRVGSESPCCDEVPMQRDIEAKPLGAKKGVAFLREKVKAASYTPSDLYINDPNTSYNTWPGGDSTVVNPTMHGGGYALASPAPGDTAFTRPLPGPQSHPTGIESEQPYTESIAKIASENVYAMFGLEKKAFNFAGMIGRGASMLGKGMQWAGRVAGEVPVAGTAANVALGGLGGIAQGLAQGEGLKGGLIRGGISAATGAIPGGFGIAAGMAGDQLANKMLAPRMMPKMAAEEDWRNHVKMNDSHDSKPRGAVERFTDPSNIHTGLAHAATTVGGGLALHGLVRGARTSPVTDNEIHQTIKGMGLREGENIGDVFPVRVGNRPGISDTLVPSGSRLKIDGKTEVLPPHVMRLGDRADMGTLTHELGHALNYNALKRGLGDRAGNLVTRGLMANRKLAPYLTMGSTLHDTLDDDPSYTVSGLASAAHIPTLIDEALASGRSAKYLIGKHGLKQGLRHSLGNIPAFGTYALGAASPVLYTAMKRHYSRKQNSNRA